MTGTAQLCIAQEVARHSVTKTPLDVCSEAPTDSLARTSRAALNVQMLDCVVDVQERKSVSRLLSVPARCKCSSGTDLLGQCKGEVR